MFRASACETMLNYEYDLMLERLDSKRGAETEFFVFADTVAARSYKGNNECHGWMGVKFQAAPRTRAKRNFYSCADAR